MLTKMRLLSAMIRLKKFNINELSEAANVSKILTSSILNRCPKEWLTPLPDKHSGFERSHQVSLIGIQSIEKELSRTLTITSSSLLDDEATGDFIPLIAIRTKVAKMSSANKELNRALRLQIEENLRWAEENLKYSADSPTKLRWKKSLDEIRDNLKLSKN
jgi:hypothetical protein